MDKRDPMWRGGRDLAVQPIKWAFTATGVSGVIAWEGRLSSCLSRRPQVGDSILGHFNIPKLRVDSVEVEELGGDAGRLTVRMLAPIGQDASISKEPIGDPLYELTYTSSSKRLEQHPRCGILAPNRPTDPSLGRQKRWEDYPFTIQEYAQVDDTRWSGESYHLLRDSGFDSYEESLPVIARTLKYYSPPSGLGVGLMQLQTPPLDAPLPAPPIWGGVWYWRLTEDYLATEGRSYSRRSQWTGVTARDAFLIYLLYAN
jgi:hypothetical protein